MSENIIKFPGDHESPRQGARAAARAPSNSSAGKAGSFDIRDHIEGRLDLNRYLVKHPVATFYVRVSGDSMTGAHINPGDILIVDRALECESGDVVIARVGDELLVKRLRVSRGRTTLLPANPAYEPIKIKKGDDFEVWGKVMFVIHHLDKEED